MHEQTKINIEGDAHVKVDPITTFDSLFSHARSLGVMLKADPMGTATQLAISAGDTIASARGDLPSNDLAEETADLVLTALVLAGLRGVTSEAMRRALERSVEQQVAGAVANSLNTAFRSLGAKGSIIHN